ncbi:alpha-glucosidase [bacterium]|nr:alpha-glucosidase [bacterium]
MTFKVLAPKLSPTVSKLALMLTCFFSQNTYAALSHNQLSSELKSEVKIDMVSGYAIKFEGGKISISNTRLGSVLENSDKFPLIEPVILYEKAKFSRGSIFLTPKIKGAATLSDPVVIEKQSKSIKYNYQMSGKCSGIFEVEFKVVSLSAIDVKAVIKSSTDKNKCNAVKVSFDNKEKEIFTGIGTQVTNVNLNGKTFMSLSQEQGHGKGKQPITWFGNKFGKGAGGLENFSYAAIPHFISSRGRSFWVDSMEHVHFDFKNEEGTVIMSSTPEMDLRINHHSTPKLLVSAFAEKFGVMKPLPDWSHKGAMLGIQGGRDKIDKALLDLKKHNANMSSVWIQDWVGTRSAMFGERLKWNWKLDRETYPKWEKLVGDYTADGLKILTYFNPRFITGSDCDDPCDFDDALRNDYLVNNPKGNTYFIGNGGFDFAKLDLSNEVAVDWYQDKIRDHLNMAPVSGWMVDFSESLPFDAAMHSGVTGKEYHNRYIEKWGQINREVSDEIVGDDAFLFMRGGVLGSHKYVNAYWLGDQLMSWDKYDGMQSALIGAITGGLSGATVNHSDIGGMIRVNILGFKITRDRKLFLKWLQMNAFSPILRTHEGTKPDLVHQFDSDEYTLSQFAYYSNLFGEMYDYRKMLLKESQEEGLPLMRGMFLEYPLDQRAWTIDDQVMLGRDIIVAPIFNKKLKNRAVYLPRGDWVELFSGKKYTKLNGQNILVNAALESIPVYVRSGSKVGERLIKFVSQNPPPKLEEK